MTTNEIKLLVEDFFNGKTSEDEDGTLYRYFSENEIADELNPEKEYFTELYKLGKIDIPCGFHSKIDSLFSNIEKKESKRNKRKRLIIGGGGVAATVAVVVFLRCK